MALSSLKKHYRIIQHKLSDFRFGGTGVERALLGKANEIVQRID